MVAASGASESGAAAADGDGDDEGEREKWSERAATAPSRRGPDEHDDLLAATGASRSGLSDGRQRAAGPPFLQVGSQVTGTSLRGVSGDDGGGFERGHKRKRKQIT